MLSHVTMCLAQAFQLLDGYVMERRPLRVAYLQRFPTNEVLARMAAGGGPHAGAGAANGAAALGRQAPAAPVDVQKRPQLVTAKVCCSP